jgi:flagellar secretion chaperone FliS
MAPINPYLKYQEQLVYTLTPGELLILLYDEAVKNIKSAIIFIKDKKICEAHNALIKSQNIFLHLIDNLDMKYPISSNLVSLYDFIYTQLVKANLEKNYSLLEEILFIVIDLKNTWQKADLIARTTTKPEGKVI